MYNESEIGKIIQSLRVKKGLTQEALCEGICSVSTMSRIENGGHEPKKHIVKRLIERLGEPGMLRGYYFGNARLEELAIKRSLLEAYEYDDTQRFETKLHEYSLVRDSNDLHERQFFEYMKLLCWEKTADFDFEFCFRAIEIMKLTKKDFSLNSGIDELILDGLEILILNGIMLNLPDGFDERIYMKIFNRLNYCVDESSHTLPTYWKMKSALMNNLAIFLLSKGAGKRAQECIADAIGLAGKEGGLYFFVKLLRTKIAIDINLGNERFALGDMELVRRCMNYIKKRQVNDAFIRKFLEEKKGLMIF